MRGAWQRTNSPCSPPIHERERSQTLPWSGNPHEAHRVGGDAGEERVVLTGMASDVRKHALRDEAVAEQGERVRWRDAREEERDSERASH